MPISVKLEGIYHQFVLHVYSHIEHHAALILLALFLIRRYASFACVPMVACSLSAYRLIASLATRLQYLLMSVNLLARSYWVGIYLPWAPCLDEI